MDPVKPDGMPGRRVVLAKTQPQYADLVANMTADKVHTRWSLDVDERKAILDGACIELITWTYGQPFQPVYLRVQGVEEPAVTEAAHD